MHLRELERLVAQGENQFVEFKRRIQYPEKVAKEAVAFANTNNGKILIGVNDDRALTGLKNPNEERFQWENEVMKYVVFPLQYTLEECMLPNGKSILLITVAEAIRKPNYAKEHIKDRRGTCYVRVNDKSMQASRELVNYLKVSTLPVHSALKVQDVHIQMLKLIDELQDCTLEMMAERMTHPRERLSYWMVELAVHGIIRIVPQENGSDVVRRVL